MTVGVRPASALTPPRLSAKTEGQWDPNTPTILALLAAFTAVWAVYLGFAEAPFAIKHDMAEAYAWGQEFQLGYNQHPPFWAWVCGLWFLLLPRTGWAFALLSSLNAGIGLWGAWRLIGDFASGQKRAAAFMLLLLTPLYTFLAYKYDANTIFLSLWPWTLHYFMKSMRDRKLGDAIGFGVFLGLALMSKYYAVILAATCALALPRHPAPRRYLTSASPYVSAAATTAICIPHVWWLLTHRAPPLRYLAAVSGQQWGDVVVHALQTMVGALHLNLGVLGVVGLVAWIEWRARSPRPPLPASSLPASSLPASSLPASSLAAPGPPLGVLAIMALAPLGLTVVSALALRTRITTEMTVGTFALVPLLAIELASIRDTGRLYRIASRMAAVLTFGALALSPAIAAGRAWLLPKAMDVEPYQEVAAAATRLWRTHTSLPLAYVGGSDWYDNAITFYSIDRPHVFVHFDYARNLWVTPEAIAKHGLLSVCVSDDDVCLKETAGFVTPDTTRTTLSVAHRFWGHVASPVQFVVTIIPPRP